MAQVHTHGAIWQVAGTDKRSVLIDQAMEMLGVSRRTVYYWIRQGRLQTIRTRCGSQRVLLSSISRLQGPRAVSEPSHSASSRVLSSVNA